MSLRRATILLGLLLLPHLSAHPSEKYPAAYDQGGWKTLSTIHFDIHYPSGTEELALRTAQLAESGYVLVSGCLRHEMKSVIPVIIPRCIAGYHECNFIHEIRGSQYPRCGTSSWYAIRAPFPGSYAEYRRMLIHAMVHSFQLSILGNDGTTVPKLSALRMPLWIAEGMAEYIAGGCAKPSRAVMNAVRTSKQPAGIRELTDPWRHYDVRHGGAGLSFIYFIDTKYGRGLFSEMIRDFRDLGFIDDVIRAGTGKSVEEIDDEWSEWMNAAFKTSCDKPQVESSATMLAREAFARVDMIPAISPDGGWIAYISDRDGFPVLKIARGVGAGAGPGKTVRTLIDTGGTTRPGAFNTEGNAVAWSTNADTIVLAGETFGGQGLIFVNASTGHIVSRVRLPFKAVRYPSVSRDGRLVAFTGIAGSAEDVYIYTAAGGSITRVTDDSFSDRNPVITPDGKSVVFASSWNRDANIYRSIYSIYRVELKTGTRTLLAGEGGWNSIQPDISRDGKRMLYVSDKSGTYNVWLYEFETKNNIRVTDSRSGVFHPRWFPDNKRFACSVSRDSGFELRVNETGTGRVLEEGCTMRVQEKTAGTAISTNQEEYTFKPYSGGIMPEHLRITANGTTGGSSAEVYFSLADLLSHHRLVLASSYMRERKKDDLNADLSYYYDANGVTLGVSIFRQATPVRAGSVEAEWGSTGVPGPGLRAGSSAFYGGALSVAYPFSRFFTGTLRIEAGGYNKQFRDFEMRKDYTAGLGKIAISLEYDALHRGAMVPVNGFRGRFLAEQTIDGNYGRTFTAINLDLQYYAQPARQCVVALRGAGGTMLGGYRGDSSYFAGGYASLRGFDLFSLSGTHLFLFTAELWLTPVDWRTFGMPLPGGAGNIGFVLFVDAGAAWTGGFNLLKNSGRFDDFKIDFGFGFRAAISPVLILKLDFAWPFDKKSFKENKIIFNMGFNY